MTRLAKMPPGGLDREGFLARYGGVYEHSPWIAGAVCDLSSCPGDNGSGSPSPERSSPTRES